MTEQQWENKIAYLGPEASFTYLAARGLFPNDNLLPHASIPECIEAVSEGRVDLAVVPLENALEGSVPLTLDYLYHEANLYVMGEVLSKIQQHLMVNKDQVGNWEKIEAVYSHPHAIAQCHKYLYYRFSGVPLNQYSSTAAAAKFVAESPDKCIAAIGNTSSAEKYGLEIVQPNIHDFHFNHTRFFVLSKQNIRLEQKSANDNPKTTLMITLPTDRSKLITDVTTEINTALTNFNPTTKVEVESKFNTINTKFKGLSSNDKKLVPNYKEYTQVQNDYKASQKVTKLIEALPGESDAKYPDKIAAVVKYLLVSSSDISKNTLSISMFKVFPNLLGLVNRDTNGF